ncbi:MAG: terminase gpA endonuclease subunit [Oscillospiraceae bacterium]
MLTAGVDVQDDRFEVEVVGWGVGKESWGIRYQKIYGDMLKEQVWRDLDAFLTATFSKKDGTQLPILCTCIDSGGHHTDQVYRFTKERYERRIFAIKGKGGQEVPYIRNPSTNNRVKTPLFVLGVDAGKALVYQRLKHEPPERKGPNYCHFPLNEEAGYDEQYFRGLTSEKAVVRFRKGRSVTVWEIKDASYKRNEPLDLRNYATAALEIANPVLKGPEETETERRQRATGRRRLAEVYLTWQFSVQGAVLQETEYMAGGGGSRGDRPRAIRIGTRMLTRADLKQIRAQMGILGGEAGRRGREPLRRPAAETACTPFIAPVMCEEGGHGEENFIDRCRSEAVAPVHAVRRSAARTALQFLNSGYGNYGANLTKKSMRGWEYHGGSSKEDIEDNIDVLRQRSRDATWACRWRPRP